MHNYAKLHLVISHDLKQNRSLCQILSFIQSYLPSDFAYFVKFADHYDCQLRTYERHRRCFYWQLRPLHNAAISCSPHLF